MKGDYTSIYVNKELMAKIDKVVEDNPGVFVSRSNFFCASAVREIRRLEASGDENNG